MTSKQPTMQDVAAAVDTLIAYGRSRLHSDADADAADCAGLALAQSAHFRFQPRAVLFLAYCALEDMNAHDICEKLNDAFNLYPAPGEDNR